MQIFTRRNLSEFLDIHIEVAIALDLQLIDEMNCIIQNMYLVNNFFSSIFSRNFYLALKYVS